MSRRLTKLVNGFHPKSLVRDARFMAALLDLTTGSAGSPGGDTLTVSSESPSPLELEPESDPELVEAYRLILEAIESESAGERKPADEFARDARRVWYPYDGLASTFPRTYRVPAPWRDTTDRLKLTYYQRALCELGPVHAVTLNLGADVELLARRQPDPARWLNKRFARRLEQVLGSRVELWFVLEDILERGPERRLHMHGCLGINETEAENARLALRRAGGEWEDAAQNQCQTKADPDFGWVSYCLKYASFRTPFAERYFEAIGDRNWSKTFAGQWFGGSFAVLRRARALYEQDRASQTGDARS